MSVFGMHSADFDPVAERLRKRAENDVVHMADVIERVVPGAAQAVEGQTFTREQLEEIIRLRLAVERGEDPAQRLQRDEMWLLLRECLNEHGLPAQELIEAFKSMDLTTLDGLKCAVDDIIELTEVIPEYAKQFEIQKAARMSMPAPKENDILRKVFELGDR